MPLTKFPETDLEWIKEYCRRMDYTLIQIHYMLKKLCEKKGIDLTGLGEERDKCH